MTGSIRHAITIVCLVAGAVLASGCAAGDGSATEATLTTGTIHRFVVPAGTGAALDRGESVEIMPDTLEIVVGDAVEIVNEDGRDHDVGLFFVRAGETVSQVFPSATVFSGVCSVSESGTFTIEVAESPSGQASGGHAASGSLNGVPGGASAT